MQSEDQDMQLLGAQCRGTAGSVEAIGKKMWKEMKSKELQLIHAVAEDIAGN